MNRWPNPCHLFITNQGGGGGGDSSTRLASCLLPGPPPGSTPFNLSLQPVPSICPFILFLQSVPSSCSFNLSLQYVPSACPFNLSLESVPSICLFTHVPLVMVICGHVHDCVIVMRSSVRAHGLGLGHVFNYPAQLLPVCFLSCGMAVLQPVSSHAW